MQKTNKLQTKSIIVLLISMFMLTIGNVFADNPQTFDAVATPISTITIDMGFNDMDRGVVTLTPMPGTFFKGPILDTNGDVVQQGDLLISLEKGYRIADVENAKATIAKDIAILEEKKEVYLRDKELSKSHSVSLQAYQAAKSAYLQAEAQVKADKATLILKEKILSFCDYYAKFDGIVNKVIFSAGYTGGERPIMEVSQLFPMGINIKMSREDASKIKVDTPITIYPLNSKEPIGAMHGASRLTKDGLQLIVNNYPKFDIYKEIDGKKLPIIHQTDTVMPFDFLDQSQTKSLAINIECIVKDAKGSYVLKAVDQQNGQAGKGVSSVIKIERVDIVPGTRINRISPSIRYIELKDSGSLKPYDLALRIDDINKSNLKDGSTVYYYFERERYLFMPGDPVKVVIGK